MALFIVGIGTEVGKTVVSSWLALALSGSYWKPVQSGSLDHTDSDEVCRLTGGKVKIFPSAYQFIDPISPHAAASRAKTEIDVSRLIRPTLERKEDNPLIIEPAGGLLSPLNDTTRMVDLIHLNDEVILVSKHYLGSINHTLLTYECLRSRKLIIKGIIFVGEDNLETETVILKSTGLPCLGKLPIFKNLSFESIYRFANQTKLTI